jgi:hypothetical protein
MLPNSEVTTFESFTLVLSELLVPYIGGAHQSGSSPEDVITEVLARFDNWREAVDKTFDHISETNAGVICNIIQTACRLRLQLGDMQRDTGNRYEEAITNYVQVIHQESAPQILFRYGLSPLARIGLIKLYSVVPGPYFELSVGHKFPNESNRYVYELADEIAGSEFEDWWGILGQAVPLFSKFSNDPRMGALLGHLEVILSRAMQGNAALEESQPNRIVDGLSKEHRQGLIAQLQVAVTICGRQDHNRYQF